MTDIERSSAPTTATCLGCGCACDDIEIVRQHDRIVDAQRACPLGAAWFGDGAAPARVRVAGGDASIEAAVGAAASLLTAAARPLVYLMPELSCEAQRAAVTLADLLGAAVDSLTSATALESILAAQERGRAGATLGEIRQRADVVLFWGVDPMERYPRYWTRYAPEPSGLYVGGRGDRTVIAVDVGQSRGPVDADIRIAIPAVDEVAVLTALAAVVRLPETFRQPSARAERAPARVAEAPGDSRMRGGDRQPAVTAAGDRPAAEVTTAEQRTAGPPPTSGASANDVLPTEAQLHPGEEARPDIWEAAQRLAEALVAARYVAIVADAEPAPGRDSGRAAALIALAHTLNGPTRAALSTLRGGGNRSGADAVLTWQTGYPAAVDFGRGYPRYRPAEGTAEARLARGEIDAAAVVGSSAFIPDRIMSIMSRIPCVVIGPRASDGPLAGAAVVIDSGVAGIHEGGMAFRMDDVPISLQRLVEGPPAAAALMQALVDRVVVTRA